MRKLAHWCVGHRLVVVAIWIVGARRRLDRRRVRRDRLPGHVQAQRHPELRRAAPAAGVGAEGRRRQRAGRVRGRRGHGPRRRGAGAGSRRRSSGPEQIPGVVGVQSPFGADGAAQISRDGRIAYADVRLAKESINYEQPESKEIIDAVRSDAGDGLRVEVSGQVARQVGAAEPQQHRHRRRRRARRAAARLRLAPRRRDAAPDHGPRARRSRSASPGCSRTSSRSRRSPRSSRC